MTAPSLTDFQKAHGELKNGILWFDNPPVRADLSGEDFKNLAEGFSTTIVEISTDELIAACNDTEKLSDALMSEGYDPGNCQREPGPIAQLLLSKN